jgi:hypothetical protein
MPIKRMIVALGGAMRIGRITAGIIAAGIGAVAANVVGTAGVHLDQALGDQLTVVTFLVVACAVLWVGDRFGIISEPYRPSVVDLYGRDDADKTPGSKGRTKE